MAEVKTICGLFPHISAMESIFEIRLIPFYTQLRMNAQLFLNYLVINLI